MDMILGASGRVGSALVRELLAKGRTVRAVVRNIDKAKQLQGLGASLAVADFGDSGAMHSAFVGGDSIFILTAEEPGSHDGLVETAAFLQICRDAAQATGARRVVGLSSAGAQHETGTGFLTASHMLEHAFDGLDVDKTFIRPSYYFSNWMMSLPVVRKYGILPTFLPGDFIMPMIAPEDVGRFAATVFAGEVEPRLVHEITGPDSHTPADIARMLGEILARDVKAQVIPEAAWTDTLTSIGFSSANARHMADMTAATISGLAAVEGEAVVLPTTFPEYARRHLANDQNPA